MTKVKTTKQTEGLLLPAQNGRGSPNFSPDESNQRPHPKPQLPDQTDQFLTLDENQFRALLLAMSKQAGCVAELAPRLGISAQFLGDVCAGRKHAGKKLLRALGAEAIPMYRVPISRGEEGEL